VRGLGEAGMRSKEAVELPNYLKFLISYFGSLYLGSF
jgi:hypothetical protein